MARQPLPAPHRAVDGFMAAAWASFVEWALGQPQIVEQFRLHADRPNFMRKPSGIELMIDKACGVDTAALDMADMEAFVRWVTDTYWGADEAPAGYRRLRAEGRA